MRGQPRGFDGASVMIQIKKLALDKLVCREKYMSARIT
jgi:hypothetical protein